MANKTLNARIVQKHDTQVNWEKATGFIPKAGEVIVYDADENYSYPRIKIGDGETVVSDLPFVASQPDWDETDETSLAFIKNKPDEEDAMQILAEMNLIDPVTDENGAIYTDENGEIFTL